MTDQIENGVYLNGYNARCAEQGCQWRGLNHWEGQYPESWIPFQCATCFRIVLVRQGAYTLDELKAHRKLWTAALRSNRFRQARGDLRVVIDDQVYMDVLGVGCEVARVAGVPITWEKAKQINARTFYEAVEPDGTQCFSLLPYSVREWLGLADQVGTYSDGCGVPHELQQLNDDGMTLPQLADFIDADPADLWETPAA